MKLIHQCFYSTCLCVLSLPAYSQQTLWYSGDTTAPSTYANGNDYETSPLYWVYQDFVIPASSPGWSITSVFSNNYIPTAGPLPTSAQWVIRSGVPAGNGGAVVVSGGSSITLATTGRSASSGSIPLTEYKVQIDGLSLNLPPGHYWLAVAPEGPSPGVDSLASQTSGANCVGTPCGSSGSAFLQQVNPLGGGFSAVSGAVNFSMGVIGTVATMPIPPVLCQANAGNPTIVRAEGITELVGDILLNCSGGTPTPAGQPIPPASLELTFNTTVTSRLLDQSTGLSEAMLMIDEPNPGSAAAVPNNTVVLPPAGSPPQMLCATVAGCAETGTGGSPSPYQTQPNVFLGQVSGSTITWSNVPIDPPGPGVTHTIRLTNLRANASQLPLSTTLIPTTITATVSDLSLNIVSPTQTAAFIQPGMIAIAEPASLAQCSSHNATLLGGTGIFGFDVSVLVEEGFASAFRRRDVGLTADGATAPPLFAQNVPGFPYNTESDFFVPALFSGSPPAGLADFGTRILLTFNNVGAGVHLFVPVSYPLTSNAGASMPLNPPPPVPAGIATAQIQLVQADQYGNSTLAGYTSVPATATFGGLGVAEVNYVGDTAYAVYEIVNSDPNASEVATIPVAVAFNVSGSLPAAAQVTVNVSEAPAGGPLAGILVADATASIPRFVNRSTAMMAFSITSGCLVVVGTSPGGLTVIVDGATLTVPQVFGWEAGSIHTIGVTSPQGDASSRDVFSSWSDGGTQSHQVSVNSTTNFTAFFTQQFFLTMSAGPGGSVNPQSNWFDNGQIVPISASPATGFSFAEWTGAGSNSYTGASSGSSVTISGPITETASFASGAAYPGAVSPNGGSASTQTFTFTFNDSNGYAELAVVDVLINSYLDGVGACYVAFAPVSATSGYLYLVDDAGDGGYVSGSPILLPSSGTLSNSQCTINGAGGSVTASGNTLTLTLAVTFASGFGGNKIFYTAARSNSQNSGWQALGTWNVPGSAPVGPAVRGVTPARSATAGQTYTFTFTDTNGYGDLAVVDILTNSFLDGIGACYVAFAPTSATSGYLYLVDDAGDGGYASGSPISLPSSSTLRNSQCTISGAGSSVSASGNTFTLNLGITFSSSFAGNQVFYLAARNNSTGNSGWQAVGSVTVP
jgi:List-Bact-rpt repeat protein